MRMLDLLAADRRNDDALKILEIKYRISDSGRMHIHDHSEGERFAVPFDITPIAQYCDRHYRDFHRHSVRWDQIVGQIRPPYANTFWEWERTEGIFPDLDPRIEAVGVAANGMFPQPGENMSGFLALVQGRAKDFDRRYWGMPVPYDMKPDYSLIGGQLLLTVFVRHDRVRTTRIFHTNMFATIDGTPFLTPAPDTGKPIPMQFIERMRDDGGFIDPEILHPFLNPVLLAISMLNTRNVQAVDVHAPEVPPKVAAKRRKRLGRDPFVYKTLSITPMGGGRARDTAERGSDDAVSRRLHIARGHFKHFTKDAPLFGRHVGTYWWNSQVRGDIEAGAVVKDYAIKQPKGA